MHMMSWRPFSPFHDQLPAVSIRWRGVMKFLHHMLHELNKNGTFVIAVLCVLFFLYLLKSEGDDR